MTLVALGSALSSPQLIDGAPRGSGPRPTVTVAPIAPSGVATLAVPDLPQPAERMDLGWVAHLVGTIVIVAVALALILAVVRAAAALAGRRTPDPIEEIVEDAAVDRSDVREVLRMAREQIDLDGDAERAVIRCWEALEALGARAGLARAESQTATDYVVSMLAAVDLPRRAAERLAALYARALFSSARLGPEDVAEARADLVLLEGALTTPPAPGAAS